MVLAEENGWAGPVMTDESSSPPQKLPPWCARAVLLLVWDTPAHKPAKTSYKTETLAEETGIPKWRKPPKSS